VLLVSLDGGAARPLEGDERGYAAAAGSLARGEGPGFEVVRLLPGGRSETFRMEAFRAPLLPLLLAPVHGATEGSPAALRWACVLLGALAAPLAASAAGRFRGDRAAWIAGVAVALWPSHAWLSTRVLSEPLDAALLLAGTDLLLRRRPLVGGLALGLAVLCRPGGLVAAAAVVAVLARAEDRGWRLRVAGFALLGMAVAVVPWLVRNQRVLGSPVLATTAGVTLLGGNCDAALAADPPGKWVPPERAWEGPFGPDRGMYGWSVIDEAASSARFAERAREWVAASPAAAAELAAWKVVRFLDPDTRSSKADAPLKRWVGWLSWGPLLLVLALAIRSGAALREPELRAALALLGGHLAAAILAYGDARMRAPVEPALWALLAAPWLAGVAAKWAAARAADTVPG
jgi:hypothetical protein